MSWTTDAENGIRGLPDVEDAKILVEDGEIREVHVISAAGKPAKLIVKDVVGLIWARYNRRIDHRIVGVVRMRPQANVTAKVEPVSVPEETAPVLEDASRIRFGSVNLYMDGARAQAQVELRWKGVRRMGSASGWCSREGAHRLVAAATLTALQEFLDDDVALGVEGVDVVRMGGHEVAIVGLALLTHRQEKLLTGCCTVGRDLPQAVVLATLSALNRVVGGLKTKEPIEYILRPVST
ncbi:MAG: hypothetical protein E4H17_04230 [Gemmatimonadales bacterium]|nr:MAG: hypothetical protein E4H17_04230 [Gemmatimonadales bacterium]